MGRVYFLERLRRSARLIEFALRLGVAKNLLREIKDHPMVSPFLDGRKIRRSEHKIHAVGDPLDATGSFMPPLSDWRAVRKRLAEKRGVKRAYPGIAISKSAKGQKPLTGTLETLIHEYGHAKGGTVHNSDIKRTPIPASVRKRLRPQDWGNKFDQQREVDIIAHKIRVEREANKNGVQLLTKVGASPSEMTDFFRNVQGGQVTSKLVHPSYVAAFKDAYRKVRNP
jgi:hypothetical protein